MNYGATESSASIGFAKSSHAWNRFRSLGVRLTQFWSKIVVSFFSSMKNIHVDFWAWIQTWQNKLKLENFNFKCRQNFLCASDKRESKKIPMMQNRRLRKKEQKSSRQRTCAIHLCLLWQRRREACPICEVLKREKPLSLVSPRFGSNQRFVRKRRVLIILTSACVRNVLNETVSNEKS